MALVLRFVRSYPEKHRVFSEHSFCNKKENGLGPALHKAIPVKTHGFWQLTFQIFKNTGFPKACSGALARRSPFATDTRLAKWVLLHGQQKAFFSYKDGKRKAVVFKAQNTGCQSLFLLWQTCPQQSPQRKAANVYRALHTAAICKALRQTTCLAPLSTCILLGKPALHPNENTKP